MSKTFYNDAVIGNSKTLACITRTGKLVRLFWPHIDFSQNINIFNCGIFFRNSEINSVSWMHDRGWNHKQHYIEDTNVLETECENVELGIKATQLDYVVPDADIVVRSYEFENTGCCERDLELLLLSSLMSTTQDMRNSFFDFNEDALIQYGHEYYIGIASDTDTSQFQIGNDVFSCSSRAILVGHNDIAMCPDAAVAWDLGKIKPGDKKTLSIYICLSNSLNGVRETIKTAKNQSNSTLLKRTTDYWAHVLSNVQYIKTKNTDISKVYKRSILVLKLMQDIETGGILAAPEFDEDFSRCGRYGYCWGRDGAYVAAAFDACGLTDEAEEFYKWASRVQEPNGSWLQRYHMDGNIAPSWGMQVDQIGTILWGILKHYEVAGELCFLQDMWNCVKKAANFLINFIDGETGLARPSYDLWEERFGEHAYSTAAVYGGLKAACKISDLIDGDVQERVQWKEAYESIKISIENTLWNQEIGRFVRSVKVKLNSWGNEPSPNTCIITVNPKGYEREVSLADYVIDISLLGLCIPYGVFDVDDARIKTTVDAIERTLTTSKAGGVKRYENDGYVGGNPWVATTLWLALYYIKMKNYEKAKKYIEWTINNRTELDLLPEQVDKENGGPAWVIPLTASHAMYILVLKKLSYLCEA